MSKYEEFCRPASNLIFGKKITKNLTFFEHSVTQEVFVAEDSGRIYATGLSKRWSGEISNSDVLQTYYESQKSNKTSGSNLSDIVVRYDRRIAYDYPPRCDKGGEIFYRQRVYTIAAQINYDTMKLAYGLAICSPEDNFRKSIGRQLALQRLFDDPVVIDYNPEISITTAVKFGVLLT